MKVAIAADHAGYSMKADVTNVIKRLGHEPVNLGAFELDTNDDYPDYALAVGRAVQDGRADRGIVVCGSGVGATVAANKLSGIRACLCHDVYSAAQGVEHDDMNVLCLGGRIIGPAVMPYLVKAFLGAKFSGEDRHQRRLDKIRAVENAGSQPPDSAEPPMSLGAD